MARYGVSREGTSTMPSTSVGSQLDTQAAALSETELERVGRWLPVGAHETRNSLRQQQITAKALMKYPPSTT